MEAGVAVDGNDLPWRCFHCGEVFTDKHAAADHFGLDLGTLPACIEVLTETQKAIVESRREWKRRAQEAEDENEKLGQQIGCHAWDLASRFKGALTVADAFNLYDSMEGRALAAEERLEMVKSQCVSNGDLNGTEDQIKHMVDRFLGWRLPENFNPDGGVSFQRTFGENTPWPRKAEPVGTNLLDAQQAEQMVRYMIEGLPVSAEAGVSRCGDEGQDMDRRRDTGGACDVSDSRKVTYRAFGLVDGRGEVIRIVEEHYVYTGNYQEACKVASALQSKEPK